jgi:hypothetical protein
MKRYTSVKSLVVLGFVAVAGLAEAKSSDVVQRGDLAALSASSVTVGSLTCPITGRTEFEDLNGNRVTAAAFSIGDFVKLKCRNGVAKSLELEDEGSGGGGDKDGDDNGNGKGKGNGGGGNRDRTRLNTRLSAISGVATLAQGASRLKKRIDDKKNDNRFRVKVKVPVPSTVPVAATVEAARALTISAILARDGVAYATCSLVYDEDALLDSLPAAEYKLDVRNGHIKKGFCDVDLVTTGEQSGVPAVRALDTITIEEALSGDFLIGTYR